MALDAPAEGVNNTIQTAFGTVNASDAAGVAYGEITYANQFLARLGDLAAGLVPPVINPIFPVGNVPPAISVPTPPDLIPIVWTPPPTPTPFSGTLDVSSIFPAPFDKDPPVLIFPTPPATFAGVTPAAPPIDLNFTYPTVSVDLPRPPALLSLQTHTFDGVVLPTIDSTIPVLTAVAPNLVAYVEGPTYTSQLLDDMRASLSARITQGGTAIPAAAEQAIYDREREKEARALADGIAALDRMESMGFALPPGVFLDAHIKLQTEFGYVAASHAREVMISQAKLEQDNILAALETAVKIEGSLIGYANQVAQRAFEASKYATEAGIAIYNAQVQAYSAILKAYEVKVEIYKAQIEAALATVQVFKIEIDAELAKAQVNTALVQQYTAEVQAALAVVDIYKAEIEAIQVRATVEKVKVEIYGEQIKAYVGQINAFTAQVEAYRASVQTQTAIEESFKVEVEAFAAQVNAAAAEANAKVEVFKAQVAANAETYEGYKALVIGQGEQVKAESEANRAAAVIYEAVTRGVSAYNEVLVKEWQVAIDEAQRVTEIGVSAAKANADLYLTVQSLMQDATKVGGQVAAQIAAAALSSVNWSTHRAANANISYQGSDSDSHSVSTSINFNTNSEA